MSEKLGLEPCIHPTASVVNSTLGRFTEIRERSRLDEVEFADYSYIMQDGSIWCATVGKFVNIAAAVRIKRHQPPDLASDAASFHLSRADVLGGCGARSRSVRLAAAEPGDNRP